MEEPGLIDYSSDKGILLWMTGRRKFHLNIENDCRPFFDPSLRGSFLEDYQVRIRPIIGELVLFRLFHIHRHFRILNDLFQFNTIDVMYVLS